MSSWSVTWVPKTLRVGRLFAEFAIKGKLTAAKLAAPCFKNCLLDVIFGPLHTLRLAYNANLAILDSAKMINCSYNNLDEKNI